MHSHGLDYFKETKNNIRYDVVSMFLEEFERRCNDRSIDIKDVKKAYKEYKKIFRIHKKINELSLIDIFMNDIKGMSFKEDINGEYKKYKDMPVEWRKDIEVLSEDCIKSFKNLSYINVVNAKYNLARLNRSYYINKNTEVLDKMIKNAEEHLKREQEKFNKSRQKCYAAYRACVKKLFPFDYERWEKSLEQLKNEAERHCMENERIATSN